MEPRIFFRQTNFNAMPLVGAPYTQPSSLMYCPLCGNDYCMKRRDINSTGSMKKQNVKFYHQKFSTYNSFPLAMNVFQLYGCSYKIINESVELKTKPIVIKLSVKFTFVNTYSTAFNEYF